jgi:hypothetical protein
VKIITNIRYRFWRGAKVLARALTRAGRAIRGLGDRLGRIADDRIDRIRWAEMTLRHELLHRMWAPPHNRPLPGTDSSNYGGKSAVLDTDIVIDNTDT